MNFKSGNGKISGSLLVAYLLGVSFIFSSIQNANCTRDHEELDKSLQHNQELTNDALAADDGWMEKREMDKLRYYGGLGKRFLENMINEFDDFNTADVASEEESSSEETSSHGHEKRMDKMKYFGGLGKRLQKNGKDTSSKRMDKMKYFGGLGKRSQSNSDEESIIENIKKNLLAKKSKTNMDRLRYMGSIGK